MKYGWMGNDYMVPTDTEMIDCLINGDYMMKLPRWRAKFYNDRNSWEKPRLDSCHELMEPGMLVYDVGAECGDFTSLYKTWVGPHGTVVPIEPSPPYWPLIRQIWEANHPGMAAPWCFVGFASSQNNLNPLHPDIEQALCEGWPREARGDGIPEFGFRHLAQDTDRTPQTRLDSLSGVTGIPDCITMDVEGAEWDALQGMYELLQMHSPIVWVSVHPPTMMDWYGKTPDAIDSYMKNFGYSKEWLGNDGGEDLVLYLP
jgi:FkbM family methyltransferase